MGSIVFFVICNYAIFVIFSCFSPFTYVEAALVINDFFYLIKYLPSFSET